MKYSTTSIYDFIIRQRQRQGPLTIRSIQDKFGIASTSTVVYHLEKLEQLGLIRRPAKQANSIQVVDVDIDFAKSTIQEQSQRRRTRKAKKR